VKKQDFAKRFTSLILGLAFVMSLFVPTMATQGATNTQALSNSDNYSTLSIPRPQRSYFQWNNNWLPRPTNPIPSFVVQEGDRITAQTLPAGENMQFSYRTVNIPGLRNTALNFNEFIPNHNFTSNAPVNNFTINFNGSPGLGAGLNLSHGEYLVMRQMRNPQTGVQTGWIPIAHFAFHAPRPHLNHFIEDFNRIDADPSIMLVRMDVGGRIIFLEEETVYNLGRFMTPISIFTEYLETQVRRWEYAVIPDFTAAWVLVSTGQTAFPYTRESLNTFEMDILNHWSERATPIEEAREILFPFYVDNLPNRRLTTDERNQWIAHYREAGGKSEFEREVARIISEIRVSHGLSRVEISDTLSMAARFYSQQRVDLNLHIGHNEGPYGDGISGLGRTGYGGSASTRSGASRAVANAFGGNLGAWLGGNGAGHPQTPQAAVDAWMNSPGHRRYILAPEHRFIGAGFVRDASGVGGHGYLYMSIRD